MFVDPTPYLDIIEKLSHIIGIPAIVGVIVWLVRTYEAGARQLREIGVGTQQALAATNQVKAVVDTMQGNHLTHMEADLRDQTVLLTNVDKNIALLVDRNPRM